MKFNDVIRAETLSVPTSYEAWATECAHGAELKPVHSLGSRPAALLPRAEPPSLDQPNHSQPAECEQENKWDGFLCSIIVEMADQYKV